MRTIADVIEAWLELQRRWMYLEGIFVDGDIRAQLPDEAKRFDDVDKSFRRIMADTAKKPNVLECCSIPSESEIWVYNITLISYQVMCKYIHLSHRHRS